jgi:alcohol dehydrogenase/propanol-preferring alcohol dehydrogenase
MWALMAAREPLRALDVETPRPQGAEVLLKVSHCGVCHTDLHFWEGEFNLGRGKVMTLADRGTPLPMALGHEIVGRVVALGPDATGVKVGDRRIVFPWIGCGTCPRCKAGDENLCANQRSIGLARNGGFATHVLVPDARYLVDPGELDPALAGTYACSGVTVLGAIRKLGQVDPDSPVLIIGAGGLGHAAIARLGAMGHRNIVVAAISEAKRRAALEAGATAVVDSAAEDVVARIAEAAQGPLYHAIDFVNNTRTANFANDSLAKSGVLVLVGIAGGELELSLMRMVGGARSIIGSNAGNLQDLKDLVALARQGKLKPIPITRMPLEQANQALQALQAGGVTGRIVLEAAQADAGAEAADHG